MTPRVTTKSPRFGWGPRRFAAVGLMLLAGVLQPSLGSATLRSITTRPAAPTVCDSVGLLVSGAMPSPCYHVIGAEIEGPTELPTMGPIPTYEFRVRITVQEPNPLVDIACPAVLQPYERGFRLGPLPVGRYFVRGVEYVIPFTRDSTAAPNDSSKLDTAFDVNGAAPCPPGKGCALLSFAPEAPMRVGRCDATAAPGGTACFDVVLMNGSPVGGVQTEIAVFEPGTNTPVSADLLHPVSVEVARLGTGFQVAWTGDGSRAKIVLFTTGSATIPPGEAHILRVCYAVAPGTPEDRYPMRYQNTVIADPEGGEIPPCLTFAEIVGSICVTRTTGCDLNGDGASDILDIVQLVHCALAGPGGDACPDSVATKADCNGDGVVNIRDVICCVRRILDGGGFGSGGGAPADTSGTTGIGFTGPAQWISPTEGRATIEITPGVGFGGMQFGINGSSSNARMSGIKLFDPTGAYQLETSVDPDGGTARVMLYQVLYFRSGQGSSPGARASLAAFPPFRIDVTLEPAAGSTGTGRLELVGARSASFSARPMATKSIAPTAEVPQSPAAGVPSLSIPAPNPFAIGTEIAYSLPSQRHVTLRVYSVSGRLIRTLVDTSMPAGVHRVPWDGRDSAGREANSGIYFFKLTAGDVERTARVMRLR